MALHCERGATVKSILAFLSLLLLTAPASAALPHQDDTLAEDQGMAYTPDANISDATSMLAAAIVRGPRGRAVIVRPRARARTFVYRGRPLAVIRRPRFVFPAGITYRRWRAGQLFPLAMIAAPFFFLEYQALGLQPPAPGYQWVRYGPDLVLVNTRTREVEDVANGAIDEDED